MLIARLCVLFAIAAALPFSAYAQTLTTIYGFQGGSDGANPVAGLYSHGRYVYGTTYMGGGSGCSGTGCGTIFKINPRAGIEAQLVALDGSDGDLPNSTLIPLGGFLWGTTGAGGVYNHGTVFKLDLKTAAETVVYSFTGGTDGGYPQGGVVSKNGVLYGTTFEGGDMSCASGSAGCGTIFSLNPATGAETVVHNFTGGADGVFPFAPLIYQGGSFFSTTANGGSGTGCFSPGCGTVYKFDPASGTESVIHNFAGGGSDGYNPTDGLIYHEGFLYGVAPAGGGSGCGGSGCGAVYEINVASNTETILYSFTGGADGGHPNGKLTYNSGFLYGNAYNGGGEGCNGYGCGTVFKIDPATRAETPLYSFTGGNDGANPFAELSYKSGSFFGVTNKGGVSGFGTVFQFTP